MTDTALIFRLKFLVIEISGIENQELLEAITSAMRALIQILTEAEPSKVHCTLLSDIVKHYYQKKCH